MSLLPVLRRSVVLRKAAVLAFVLALGGGLSRAAVYYVDGSATGCGGSTCSDSNNGTSEATAFKTPYGCLNKPLRAGDQCLIKNGTYVGANGALDAPSYSLDGLAGTSASPIVIKNFPGHAPVLCRNNGSGACAQYGVVLGTNDTGAFSYVRIEGLTVQGATWIWGNGTGATHHVTVTGNDLSRGGGYCDNNFSILRVDHAADVQVDHNHIHTSKQSVGCPSSPPGQAYQDWVSSRITVEYNTFEYGSGDTFEWAIFAKDCPNNSVYRYNDVKNGSLWHVFQINCSSAQNNAYYGNLVRAGSIKTSDYSQNDSFYNNTVIGGGFRWNSENSGILTSNVYNNIVHGPGNSYECNSNNGCNVVIEDASWADRTGYKWDFNAYDSDAYYGADRYGPTSSTETSLANWRTRSGFDGHSLSGNAFGGGPCQFNNAAAGDYTLATSSPCKTAGCANWPTCSTTGKELGAYGVTTCVGNTCGATGGGPDTTPPVRSSGAPSGSLPSGTTQTTISLGTNENATCRYATTAGVAYASMTRTFTTTGATSHSTLVTGLVDGGSYTYYVRCIDAASNANPDDYPIAFTVSNAAPASTCASPPAGTIFCDDFEDTTTPLTTKYTDYDSGSGRFVNTTSEAHSGTHSMSARYDPGTEQSGYLWYNFGRNPAGSKTQTATDFTDVYWRVWMKIPTGFSGNPMKFSRARVLARSDYTDAATGHVWQGAALNLALDPATGVASDGQTLMTSGYNDWPHYTWLGAVEGATQVYDSNHQGRWQCVEVHMKLNTPGQSDGLFEMWVDGALDARKTGLNWRGSYTAYGINHFALENWWNGGTAPKTETRYLDDLIISTQPIGCTSGVPSDTTPPGNVPAVRRIDKH